MLTLLQIYWRGKINQLSRVTRGFLTSSLFSLSSCFAYRRFTALLLENLWHPGYCCCDMVLRISSWRTKSIGLLHDIIAQCSSKMQCTLAKKGLLTLYPQVLN